MEWFERWWPPLAFLTVVLEHNRDVPSDAFFARAELQPLREAYAAGLFATILSETQAVALRLRRDRFPDFDLRIGEHIQAFELVEADKPGRRRGDEYKEAAQREAEGLPPSVEHFDPDAEEQAAPEAIREAIAKKAQKSYAPAPPLLVYVNFWLFHAPSLTPEQFAALSSVARAVSGDLASLGCQCHPMLARSGTARGPVSSIRVDSIVAGSSRVQSPSA